MIDCRFTLDARGEASKVGDADMKVTRARRKERDMASKLHDCEGCHLISVLSRTGLGYSEPTGPVG